MCTFIEKWAELGDELGMRRDGKKVHRGCVGLERKEGAWELPSLAFEWERLPGI